MFLRSHILLAMRKPVEAVKNLIDAIDGDLVRNEGFIVFLLNTCQTRMPKVGASSDLDGDKPMSDA